jgi:hypothetical protein
MASAAEQLELDMGDQPTPEELEAQRLSEAEANKGTPSPEELVAQEAATKKAADDAAAAEAAKLAAEKKPDQTGTDDERNLRALAREQKRELDRQNIELEKMRRQMEKAGLVDEEDKKAEALEQAKAKEAYETRMTALTNILETMKVNPTFADVETVVSQDHFDDLVEAMAKAHVAENGGSQRDVEQKIAQWIWGLPNPYEYAYQRIKTYHPAFRKAAPPSKTAEELAAEKAAADKAAEEAKNKGKKPPEIPPSINNAPGASSGPGGWTAAMIEALDEEDLPTVPKDVYNKYLLGDLK